PFTVSRRVRTRIDVNDDEGDSDEAAFGSTSLTEHCEIVMASHLNQPHFKDADKAREYLESVRWPSGPICPHCASVSKDHYRLEGKAHRVGLLKCKDCREQFSVTVGTVFERSKIAPN